MKFDPTSSDTEQSFIEVAYDLARVLGNLDSIISGSGNGATDCAWAGVTAEDLIRIRDEIAKTAQPIFAVAEKVLGAVPAFIHEVPEGTVSK
jgi:hypothetical protein